MFPGACARTVKVGSYVLLENPFTTDLFKSLLDISFLLQMLLNLRWQIYHIGQSSGLFCFEHLSCEQWVDWSLFWHPLWWNAYVDNQITQRKRRVCWHPYPHSKEFLSSAHLHHCTTSKSEDNQYSTNFRDKVWGTSAACIPSVVCEFLWVSVYEVPAQQQCCRWCSPVKFHWFGTQA